MGSDRESPDVQAALDCLAAVRDQLDKLAALIGASPSVPKPLRITGRLTRIERDPKLRTFIDARLGTMSQIAILAACRDTFGPARAPSQSGLNRYVQRVAASRNRSVPPARVRVGPGNPCETS